MNDIYYNIRPTMQKYPDALLYLIAGQRGIGKSTSVKCFILEECAKNECEFLYVRRYEPEIKTALPDFFTTASKITGIKVKREKKIFKTDERIIGRAIALSKSDDLKSAENLQNVRYLFFDEFIIDKGLKQYIPGEVELFLRLLDSISRGYNDIYREVKVIMIGNTSKRFNPYYNYFGLTPPRKNQYKYLKDKGILLSNPYLEKFAELKSESKFGRLVNGTSYADYSISGDYMDENENNIMKKGSSSRLLFSIYLSPNKCVRFWQDFGNILIASFDGGNTNFSFCTEISDVSEKLKYIKTEKFFKDLFKKTYEGGTMFFESVKVRGFCDEIYRRL